MVKKMGTIEKPEKHVINKSGYKGAGRFVQS